MSLPVYIDANEFMKMLQDRNLVIVSQDELALNAEMKRQQLLKRKDLSLSEIVNAGFFKVKDTSTLIRWCIDLKFGPDGYYQLKNGQYRILTSAIKSVLYGNEKIK